MRLPWQMQHPVSDFINIHHNTGHLFISELGCGSPRVSCDILKEQKEKRTRKIAQLQAWRPKFDPQEPHDSNLSTQTVETADT